MTLIIASATNDAQLLMADRVLTDASSNRMVDDAAYKLINYFNTGQNYRCGVAYTGLSQAGSFSTLEWLLDLMPRTLDSKTDIYSAIDHIRQACDDEYLVQLRGLPIDKLSLTIILCGRYDKYGGSGVAEFVPFLSVITNNHDDWARQSRKVAPNFRAFSSRVLRKSNSISICRGDLFAAAKLKPEIRMLFRYLRRPINYRAKARLIASFIQQVSSKSNTVGDHVLGIAIQQSGQTEAFDFAKDEQPDRPKTMPHVLSDSGAVAMNFTVTPLKRDRGK